MLSTQPATGRSRRSAAAAPSARVRAAVLALAVSTFCYVMAQSLPVGLLPQISAGLHVSLSTAGMLVTGYGLIVAVMSVPLTMLTGRVPRRLLLGAVLFTLTVATALAAAIPNYWVLFGSRILTALTHSVYWSVLAATATAVHPTADRGRVIATVYGGGSLAVVLGVPAATWLGQAVGWQWAFWVVTGLALFSLVMVTVLLPSSAGEHAATATGAHPDRRRYILVVVITMLLVMGAYTGYTYIAPFLIRISGFPAEAVGPLLLADGVGGVVGVTAAGSWLSRRPRRPLALPAAVLVAALFGLVLFGAVRLVVPLLLAMFGFSISALSATLQDRVMEVAPGNVDLATAGNSSAFNVGIAGGALLGGLLLPHFGVRFALLVGAVIALGGLAIILTERTDADPAPDR